MPDAAIFSGPIVLLTRLSRLVHRASTPELLGINLKDLGALAFLRDHARTTQQALAEGLCVDANYCVLMLNDLETAGLIERRRDPADRRRHLVAMTEAGRLALERAEHAQESIEDEVLAGLAPAERDTLARLLRQALDGAARRPPAQDRVPH
ncbi:MarR family winged helix-turn-helix transcriptional regulator [Frankia sp. R82]|uniref:MarR family winged helix-turn-helix transcriptional regulator n=1 Tax=Frankia sp. R82 TaxID=2950553 RepID=UPI0020431658|nr:MarR family transcriptional regulator [Frankia sp. R82]MCM3883505.1 MarR family transcriptional regulator [Frankia sp. R82]